jgi:glycosyltransferase involved in cell wall biosynthesis
MKIPEKPIIVVDARLINTSGIGTVIQNILPALYPLYRVVLLGNAAELKKFKWALHGQIIDFNSSIYSLAEQVGFIIKIPACDIFISPHYNIPLLPVKAKARAVIIHDINHIALKQNLSFSKKIYARFVITSALKFSKIVITVSEFSKAEIIKFFGVKEQQIKTIKLGIDKAIFKEADAPTKEKISKKYNLPPTFLLYVGNVKPHKNLRVLVKALAHLRENNAAEDIYLVIVGKKEGFITKDNSLLNLIQELDLNAKIIFTGYLIPEDLPVIYSLAKIFVFPSFYEGFGLPPVEAMACGCPVLVSNASSLPEVCQAAALYFDPTDSTNLSQLIQKVWYNTNLQAELKVKGLELAQTYNWQNTNQAFLNIIRTLENNAT